VFKSANIVIYIAALSDYCKLCYEDDKTNRLRESLNVFEEVINNSFFKNTPIILLLNKIDVFDQRLKTKPLKDFFDQYEGGEDTEKAYEFIKKMFLDKDTNVDGREIICSKLIATESSEKVKEIIDGILEKVDGILEE
jgi:guanine nucleotide-binding protein alpha-1 subunit